MQLQHHIGNSWTPPASGERIPVIDPSNGQVIGELARGDERDVDSAVAAARSAIGEEFSGPWGSLTAAQRGRCTLRYLPSRVVRRRRRTAVPRQGCDRVGQ